LTISRRSFLSSSALLCSVGGTRVSLREGPGEADAVAAQVPKPGGVSKGRTFPLPQPTDGGIEREYWVQARTVRWDVAPTGRDGWHGTPIRGKRRFKAFVYQLMTTGFAAPAGPAQMPGPTLHAEVGDVLVVHFRNTTGQPVTMHPHGVFYTPDDDGTWLGEATAAGGQVDPGEEFSYWWHARPDSVGVWPYHDHGPNHMANTFRGMFGAIVVRERGAQVPDVEAELFLHSLLPPFTGLPRAFQCVNGRAGAGNTPTVTAKVGQDVALHVLGMDDAFHDFHLHGHRWRDPSGVWTDNPTVGPNQVVTARFTEDNPGRWLYHCHVFSHQEGGMAGFYDVTP
jgi:FtsP/CotA-like multicopper oxidase with cupredoxin domain